MKRSGLIALLLALPLALQAQFAVFTDTFTASTTNQLSVPGGTPAASFTSYDIASSKAATTNTPIGSGRFRIALNAATTSGFVEAEALFAASPISLNTVGDFINLTYTFTNTSGTIFAGGPGSFIYQGLYNSAGVPPLPGQLANAGLTITAGSTFATGNAANWQGYVSRIANGGASSAFTRPLQNGAATTSGSQDLVFNNAGSGAFNNPGGTTFDVTETAPVVLVANSQYTVSYTIALTDVGTLTITNILYDGVGTTGAVIFSQTNLNTGATFLTNSFDGFAIGLFNKGTSFNPTMDITRISITENIFGTPGPSFGVTGGGTGCPGSSFAVGLTGSVTTNDYRIFTNGVFNGVVQTGTGAAFNFAPETVGTVALTNTVQASNTVSTFTGFMSGSVVVAPFGAPVITGQPSPLLVGANGIGTFTVVSSGSGLGYQWFRNGAPLSNLGHFSGTTTSTLVVSPATVADVATTAQGYYVVVTNSCGLSATSITNSLTLIPPANIVWQGNDTNNVWDVATTANFTNGAGPVVFHNGDNATFDDTSLFPAVKVSGSLVAPTSITENSSLSYSFTGSGSITGPGTLLMNGFGTLSISNINTYTGGTTISNGTVVMGNSSFSALGSGPVTLAGGTLDIPIGGSSTIGFSNTINAVTDSTLKYDLTGTFADILSGPVMGNSGVTLTISCSRQDTALARVRLYSPFTNNANIVLTSAGSQMEIAPYLTSGDQIYNGVISGFSGRFVPRGNGNAIFNNANTFTDTGVSTATFNGYSLLMSSGNAGLGADSVSSTPGTIDASPAGVGKIGINVGNEGGTCSLFANGGAHTIGNTVAFTSTTNTVTLILSGSNSLTFSGEFDLATASDTAGTNRTLQVDNTAATTLSGTVTDNGFPSGITKTGNGSLYLNGVNTYSGPTVVNAGVLAGNSTIISPVTTQTNGAIGGGSATTIGTLTINNSLTLAANAFFRVNKSLSPSRSNDVVSVSGALSNTGTGVLTVSNTGPALAVGDRFVVFNKAVANGNTMTITGGGMNWANNLAVDGSIQATSINTGPVTTSTNIAFSVSGGVLSLSWPANHLGWYLQTETNLLGNNWVDVAGSSTVTNVTIPIVPNKPAAFYRMSLQP